MAQPASTLAGRLGRRGRDAVPRPARRRCRSTAAASCTRSGSRTRPTARCPRERDNVILVCHALSGDAHAAGVADDAAAESTRDGFAADDRDGTAGKGLGWWDGMIGPGKAFDTDRYFVVSTNLLGGCRGTTGPVVDRPGHRAAVRRRTSR